MVRGDVLDAVDDDECASRLEVTREDIYHGCGEAK